jgi:hypothetical protein
MPRGAAVSGCWLDAGARVDKGGLSLQQEGAATVADLDLNEGPGVAGRLAIGMMRRDEDCTSLSLNRVFKVTPADREIPSRCGSARGDVGRGPVCTPWAR